ncbi:MAG: MAPEG family protein [Lysobacterales bacterium]
MFYKPLLYPLLIQVGLTFLVWLRMYQTRLAEIQARQIDPNELATRRDSRRLLNNTAAADNFSNQFELPVLFYLAIMLALTLMLQDRVIVFLAWVFVILRVAHAIIHLSYNNVTHRFLVYVAGGLAVIGMWVRLGFYVISQ